jgi:hypothetical protein
MLCTILCEEKINQVVDKIVDRKKIQNPNFLKGDGTLLWDLMDELANEGITVVRCDQGKIEVINGTLKEVRK